MSATASLFVWYRLAIDASVARPRIAALLDEVHARTGVRGRVMGRDEPGRTTWMEVYEAVPDPASFARTLDALAREVGAEAAAADGRHAERFAPLELG